MRILFSLTLALIIMSVGKPTVYSLSRQVDFGTIQELSEEKITVLGEAGLHVFDLVGVCAWCEEGANVIVFFESITRSQIRPEPNPLQMPLVQMLIIRDGREESFE